MSLNHPILEESFAIIDHEIGEHDFTPQEYAIIRRIIHATADFDFTALVGFSESAIASGIMALRSSVPIVTDVGMVKKGIQGMVAKTFDNPIIVAVETVKEADAGKTRTETGLLKCLESYPHAIYIIGNAPTALIALCHQIPHLPKPPPLVIGAPVGFVSVVESKHLLAQTPVPQIRVEGRKGGSSVASAILNALLVLAWEE